MNRWRGSPELQRRTTKPEIAARIMEALGKYRRAFAAVSPWSRVPTLVTASAP